MSVYNKGIVDRSVNYLYFICNSSCVSPVNCTLSYFHSLLAISLQERLDVTKVNLVAIVTVLMPQHQMIPSIKEEARGEGRRERTCR